MRNPLERKTNRRYNGSVTPIEIRIIEQDEAVKLLSKVKRQAIYRPYIPTVFESIKKLGPKQSISFHVPTINGRPQNYTGKYLMSVLNTALKRNQMMHRLRYISSDNLLVSERVAW